VGRHKNNISEKRTRIPPQRSIADINRMMSIKRFPGMDIPKSDMTLNDYLNSQDYQDFLNKKGS